MPIKIPNNLPATEVLLNENIFVMDEDRAYHQQIRPLKIILLNLMPLKVTTENQILRLLSNTPLQVEVTLLYPESYSSKNTPEEHLSAFYNTFREIKNHKFDGMIITGAPVERMDFTEVDYWPELKEIMEWSKTSVTSTLHICWASQAGLYYHFDIPKYPLEKKIFGVYPHSKTVENEPLFKGFDDIFYVPQSRHTEVRYEDIIKNENLDILSVSEDSGVYIVATKDRRQIFVSGHSEYDADTLKFEYDRDIARGMDMEIPANYYPNNDPSKQPIVLWRGHANLLFSNWLNYYVYQTTPYLLD